MKKYNKAFNTDSFRLDWEKIYLLPFKTTLHTKLREFQHKIRLPVVLFLQKGVRDFGTFVIWLSKSARFLE